MSKSAARYWAVLPAAGTGSRMGSEVPKQYLEIAGSTLVEHSVRALLGCDELAGIVVPIHCQDRRMAELEICRDPRVHIVTGAEHRSGSVLAGLKALLPMATAQDWILVHDAARPCLQSQTVRELIQTVAASGIGAILAQPVVDTVKQASADSQVLHTLDRSNLWRAQTPQMFRFEELRLALAACEKQELSVTDEAAAMEAAGYPVQLIAGPADNLKVTVVDDLALAEWYLRRSTATGLTK